MDNKYQGDIKKKLNYKLLKRTMHFVLSLSVFSFFVWYSSGFSIVPQCFNAYFSTCLFSMLTRTFQRKYMFIICNAILALLAISPSHIEFQASTTKAQVSEEPVRAFRFVENAPLVIEEEEMEEAKRQEEYSEQVSEDEPDTDTLFIAEEDVVGKDEEAEEEGGTGDASEVMVAKDDKLVAATTKETNEDQLANTDELNRKFEEFIRKMKEEMRIEAQRQPIEV
ncbi:unnamed protein product [Sphenostylis stenocarpa]|uniref:DUF4408 domain-containing protein n=1 Tax=Sphenostylis stenocarpa TaxID=92480 RepID=A0AA86S4G2_9FABA|nr:unnamed protein product [Sphenostylis stenocarpa]